MSDANEDFEKLMAGVGTLFCIGALVATLIVAYGWVTSVLWGWFAVPLLGLPSLGVLECIGLKLVFASLRGGGTFASRKPTGKELTMALLAPFLTLLAGWIVKRFT